MAFRKEKSVKNREHELRIVEILSRSHQLAQMLQPQQPVNLNQSFFLFTWKPQFQAQ